MCACGGGSIWTSSATRAACVARPAESPSRHAALFSRAAVLPRELLRTATVSASSPSLPTSTSVSEPVTAPVIDSPPADSAPADSALVASLPLDPEGRTWLRLDGPGGSEAWLISWPPGTGTGWHDHAESTGAFTIAAGTLREHSLAARLPTDGWKTLELSEGVDRTRLLATGQGRAFGRHHVHEVLNESGHEHAVSVHAYYPPLPQIRRYSRSGAVLRLEQTERPEDWQ